MADQERYQVIISTADGRVFESEVCASSAVGAAVDVAAEVDSLITNLHVRQANH